MPLLSKKEERWLRKHEKRLPKMSDGERINGDPIIYMGKAVPDWICSSETIQQQNENHGYEKEFNETAQKFLEYAFKTAGLTPLEAYCLALDASDMPHKNIAANIGFSRSYTTEIIIGAKNKLKNNGR